MVAIFLSSTNKNLISSRNGKDLKKSKKRI
jgi:hypothetical protein